jgi:hypothetical protein
VYSGCSYKPQSHVNNHMHGDFAASVVANLTILSSENSRLEDTTISSSQTCDPLIYTPLKK